jgi:methionyl-tRNA formyltransferase
VSVRALFVGSKRMGLRCLAGIQAASPDSLVGIVTLDDSADTRQALGDLQQFGCTHGVPVTVVGSRREADRVIGDAHADLVVVCGWYWMIGAETLATARHGFVGVHNSLLPRYRGAAPIVWAMLNGERRIGLTMYSLTEGMDEGDIWAQAETEVGPDDYIACVLARLEDACEEMVGRVFPRLLDGSISPLPQDAALATFGARRRAEDGRIGWTESAERIYRLIRAQSLPYPGAFTTCGGWRMTIWKAHPFRAPYFGRPGELARGPSGEVLAICGDHRALVLEELQFEGRSASPAREAKITMGTVLGE